ncbi:4555_t:CDS:2 [Entrophospora sp. SA101]|nr:4555_t:CDS:2 [Entrophospora sp. SA101]
MADAQSKVDTLEEQNSKLIAEIAELRKENAKLKQIIEENEKRDVRVEELEQKNIELETRLAILEQEKNQNLSSDNSSKPSNSSRDIKTVPSGTIKFQIHHVKQKPLVRENDQTEISELEQDDGTDKNQIVEQGLIEELGISTEKQGLMTLGSPFGPDSAIDNTSSTEINTSENKCSAQHLSYLFKTAIKSRQEEIINWYYYSLEFENKIHTITADAIQKKLGIISNINQTVMTERKKAKKLADSYELLLELVGDLIPIQGKLGIDINPVLEAELKRDRASSDKPIRLFDLLLCLEDDIATIQEKIGIVGYTNQEIAEEADKNARVYLRKFEKFHGPLEDVPSVLIQKFIDSGVKKFWFTDEGLPLFPNVSPQQLHEVFVKKSASVNQCPCLELKVKQGKLSQI